MCIWEFLDVTMIPDWGLSKKENVSQSVLPEKIRNELFQNPQRVYKKCPYWKTVENIAYR